jgi:F-type H+-transporting ATPase subunit b
MSIDWWTLGFQTINVAVLMWLLGHFFWKPVAGLIEARRASVQTLTDDAESAQSRAKAAEDDNARTRAGFAKEREKILTDARKDAETARTALLAQAKIDAEALHAAAKVSIAMDAKAQEKAWAGRSANLAVDIASRLAARLAPDVVQRCFLEWLVEAICKLSDAARQAALAEKGGLELASARVLDAAAQTVCTAAIAEALGGAPRLAFRTDAALICGFELRGGHLDVRSSWRSDLATIQADLAA